MEIYIVPNIFLAKVISILISVTSIVCISVFLISILLDKEELSKSWITLLLFYKNNLMINRIFVNKIHDKVENIHVNKCN